MDSHIGTEQFPICFESQDVVVFTNPSGEVFVQSKRNPQAKLRITTGRGLELSTFGGNPFVIRQIAIAG
ncbi:MAG: hypothetical protein ACJ8BW_00635 [Ktedonobacteraceae bacterium]